VLTEDLIRKVRQIEFSVRRIVDDMMAGQYKSFFKGTGVQFSEHRQYYAGDDIRHIDWNVSARSRDLLVKKFEEERELNLLLVVDVSGSEQFGSSVRLKSEILAELAGMLAYAAVHTGDKVGALLFASEVEKIIRTDDPNCSDPDTSTTSSRFSSRSSSNFLTSRSRDRAETFQSMWRMSSPA
jgi:uncharacterized protein (DUF58 family)